MSSFTPKTDSAVYSLSQLMRTTMLGNEEFVEARYSRQIEKELNATTAELERTKEQLRVAREALTDARKQFSRYATVHLLKNTAGGDAKARQNELMAEKMSDALNHLAQSNPDKEEPNVPLE